MGLGLSPQERRVTDLVLAGRSTRQLAHELFISPYTVQDHLKSIFQKVGVSGRPELKARLFVDHALPGLYKEPT